MSNVECGEAGSVGALAGFEDATAEGRASPVSSCEREIPDETRDDDTILGGADVLDCLHRFVTRFICYPSESAAVAHVLWIAHTHLMGAWFTTPRLAVLSADPASGKSRLLEITFLLVPNPILSVQSSPAYIMRKIADQENLPTVLWDEIDAIYGANGRGNEDLRAMLNAGYRRGATSGRCYTDRGNVLTVDLPTFAPVALSGLGELPSTLMSRSVIIPMRKRAPGETVDAFRPRQHEAEGHALADRLAEWASLVAEHAKTWRPDMPEGIADRDEDLWHPLLAVADLAGGAWPDLARETALTFVNAAKSGQAPSLGTQLLADIQRCFGSEDKLPSRVLVERLVADEEAPWGDLRGRRLDVYRLSAMLRPYGVTPTNLRLPDGSFPRGYKREAFYDAWKRYVPKPGSAATDATDATSSAST